jgi:hypothetical protein
VHPLRDAHRAWKADALTAKRAAEKDAVDAAMKRLDEAGIYPGRERIQRALPGGIWLRNPDLRRRWKRGLEERGLL